MRMVESLGEPPVCASAILTKPVLTRLETSPPIKSLFGPAFWVGLAVALFVYSWSQSGPPDTVQRDWAAMGPDGTAAYFQSPETAVARATLLLERRDWRGLAAFYDLSGSTVAHSELLSGAYFTDASGQVVRPFPPGYRLLKVDRLGNSTLFAATVVGDLKTPGDVLSGKQLAFWLSHSPDGYRLVPNDQVKVSTGRPSER